MFPIFEPILDFVAGLPFDLVLPKSMDKPENRDAVDSLDAGPVSCDFIVDFDTSPVNRDVVDSLDTGDPANCDGFKDLATDPINWGLIIDFDVNPVNRDAVDSLDAGKPTNCFEVEDSNADGVLNVPIPIFSLVN